MDSEPSSSTSRKRKIDRPRAKNVPRQPRGGKKRGKGKNKASQADTDSSEFAHSSPFLVCFISPPGAADEEDEPLEKRPRTQVILIADCGRTGYMS